MTKPDFSLDNFKKWMESNPEQGKKPISEDLIGTQVQSKVSYNKLMNKIELEEGIEEDVCTDFFEEGGIIVDVEDKQYLIEVASGKFYLHKSYVEKN